MHEQATRPLDPAVTDAVDDIDAANVSPTDAELNAAMGEVMGYDSDSAAVFASRDGKGFRYPLIVDHSPKDLGHQLYESHEMMVAGISVRWEPCKNLIQAFKVVDWVLAGVTCSGCFFLVRQCDGWSVMLSLPDPDGTVLSTKAATREKAICRALYMLWRSTHA